MINLNEYLAEFPGSKASDKIGDTELNETLLNVMPNVCNKQAYVQGFDCETFPFEKADNMFERMQISENIYEAVLEPSYKNSTRAGAKCTGRGRQIRGGDTLSKMYSKMGNLTGMRKQKYVDHPRDQSKLTYLIHSLVHSSY